MAFPFPHLALDYARAQKRTYSTDEAAFRAIMLLDGWIHNVMALDSLRAYAKDGSIKSKYLSTGIL